MLKTRVLTALVLAPAALLALFFAPPVAFQVLLAALLLVGTWEFRTLADLNRAFGAILLILQAAILALLMGYADSLGAVTLSILATGCMVWLIMLLRLATFRPANSPRSHVDLNYRVLGFFAALACVTFAWFSVAWLRRLDGGEWWVILLLLIIWSADIGAYFTGRAIGRHKLAPSISPGKTWEGVAGGVVLAALTALAMTRWVEPLQMRPSAAILLAVITAVVSVGGDLFISLHKRSVGVKDAGRIFPGHGGVLDRLDSLLSGAPFFALIAWWQMQ